MEIRRANKTDCKRILELLVEVGNVHAEIRPDLFIKDKTKYNEFELETIINDDNKPIFVYINDSLVLCGYAFCMINEIEGNNLVKHKSIYIDDICVDSSFRHNNVGTSLYNHIINYAKMIGCYNVTLNVWEGNKPARNFYEKCGLQLQKSVLEKVL